MKPLTSQEVIELFMKNWDNKKLLQSGYYVTNEVRIELYCCALQGSVGINGISRDITFYGYGDGLYKACIEF